MRTTLKGTTFVNAGFLAIGSILASWMGTTGAAMLLVRPFLRVNKHRKYRAFMVVFFIFMVANVGGALTPLGDPPLFLGFLHGVPFSGPHLILPMLLYGVLLLIYIAFDKYYLLKEKGRKGTTNNEPPQTALESGKTLEILGTQNFALLAAIIGVIIFSGSVKMAEVSIRVYILACKM